MNHKQLLFLVLLIMMTVSLSTEMPDKAIIKKIVIEEIKKENENNKSIDFMSGLVKHIFQPASITFEYLGLTLFIIFTLSVFFILFRTVTFRKAQAAQIQDLQKKNKDLNFDQSILDSFENNKDYSQAIVYLHKCTIFFLLAQKIIRNKNMTNLSLYSCIKDTKLREAFHNIYSLAEYILFNEYSATSSDFSMCKNMYFQYFKVKEK